MKFHLIAHLAPVFSRTRFAGIVATRDYSTYLPQKSMRSHRRGSCNSVGNNDIRSFGRSYFKTSSSVALSWIALIFVIPEDSQRR